MAGRAEQRWRLHVDESGRFDSEQERVAVVGLLLPAIPDRDVTPWLERELDRIAPGMPRPLHAWMLRQPAAWALAARLAGSADAHGKAAADALEAALPGEWATALEQMEAPSARTWEALKALRRGVDDLDRDLRDWLEGQERRATIALSRLLRELDARACHAAPSPGAQARIVVAGEPTLGASAPGPDSASVDRYLDLLETLIERAHDLVASLAGNHVIEMHVLTRDVAEPVLGRASRLHSRHLAELGARIGPATRRRVRLVPGSTPEFRVGVHPALVLADFLANRTRPLLRGALSVAERGISDILTIPVRRLPPPASPLAASGSPRRWLADFRAGSAPPAPIGPMDDWARDQAVEWARVEARA